jgi:hypothetical protein
MTIRHRVLVAEDDADSRDLYAFFLERVVSM